MTMCYYAITLYEGRDATLNDIRDAVTTLEDLAPTARRVLGNAHPVPREIESHLRAARAVLRVREAGKNVVFVKE